ncbi:hypothetical protein [Methanococcus maripaludis]|uniref:Uncharacterized protein n=1 Tax=Methanococcus maripaludis TaxID=39152 RepID=A0A7J9PMP7_METMI|nr:hypothetical protein [Methanococcus maripaludis]MBA2863996.1 hypothetical protein [Methanococcus maripaludis]
MIGELALGVNAYIDYETQKVSLFLALATGIISFLECMYFNGIFYSLNLFLDVILISALIYGAIKVGLWNYINIGDWWMFPAVAFILFDAGYGLMAFFTAYILVFFKIGRRIPFLPLLWGSTIIFKVVIWQGFLQ